MRLTVAARRETAAKLIEGGMSQRQAAKALGVSHTQVAKDLAPKLSESGNKVATKAERRAQRELELASASEERHELEQIDEALGVRRWLWGAREASINETETARWPALRVRPDRR